MAKNTETTVSKNDIVKIKRDGERFWIVVKYIYKDNKRIKGIVDNNTVNGKYKINDQIVFERDEIVDIYGKKN